VSLTQALAEYIASARDQALPSSALDATKFHILDTVAACVSGAMLEPGKIGASFSATHSPPGKAVIFAGPASVTSAYAVLANGMAGHADETDDSHDNSKVHPGCSIVPTALAVAHEEKSSGSDVLRAVALGYDVGPRLNMTLWPRYEDVRAERRGTSVTGGAFGSASAAASLRGLDPVRVQHLLSYVAQQVSGMNTWLTEAAHVEKAYMHGAWPAYSALLALSLVEHGLTGNPEILDGDPNFIDIVGKNPDRDVLLHEIGSRFEIERTNLKPFPAGSPVQAPLQGLFEIMRDEGLSSDAIHKLKVTIPTARARTVASSRSMANINLNYLLSIALTDGEFTFDAAHDHDRFEAWRESGGDSRVEIIADDSMAPKRQAIVEVTAADGSQYRRWTTKIKGSYENPMTYAEVEAKAVGLIAPVLGRGRAEAICTFVLSLEDQASIDELMMLLVHD